VRVLLLLFLYVGGKREEGGYFVLKSFSILHGESFEMGFLISDNGVTNGATRFVIDVSVIEVHLHQLAAVVKCICNVKHGYFRKRTVTQI
jgi:hypothetical protein